VLSDLVEDQADGSCVRLIEQAFGMLDGRFARLTDFHDEDDTV
jgi:hypothetical protein